MMTVSADAHTPIEYRIDGTESMGNGGTMQAGHASILLSDGGKLGLPDGSLTIRGLFPGESVEFLFRDLDQETRTKLRRCFSGN
jgi:hypothetical protein